MKLKIIRRSYTHAQLENLNFFNSLLARLYAARGIASPDQLTHKLESLLPVSTLDGIHPAVDLLIAHRKRQSQILIVGDFDADGATSTALIVRALRAWGYENVDFLVPNRFEYGYGLTPEIVMLAHQREPQLIITVDNGISSISGVAAARNLGIDVLVTDHHLAGAELPNANVIVNPNMPGSSFGSRSLAGVGVAFYVMVALYRSLNDKTLINPATWLDLVALGTVADVVPLDNNNRVLIAQGLERIRAGRCTPGLRALLEIGGRNIQTVIASDLGFAAGPRLNAAGRLDDMSIGISCLLADNASEANNIASRLDQLNLDRRAIEATMQDQALAAVRHLEASGAGSSQDRYGVCLYDPSWHQGVVGLVAGRLKEKLRRPVIAFADGNDGELRGSARSVNGVHVRDLLQAIDARRPGLLIRFGGHAMAAGLSLRATSLDEFAREFDDEVAHWQQGGSLADRIETDGELRSSEISLDTAQLLRSAGPWGQAFPEPQFDQVFNIKSTRVVGERHLKMWVELEGEPGRFDAIAFNFFQGGDVQSKIPERARLVYRLDINEYGGERRLQLIIDQVLSEHLA